MLLLNHHLDGLVSLPGDGDDDPGGGRGRDGGPAVRARVGGGGVPCDPGRLHQTVIQGAAQGDLWEEGSR